MPQETRIRSELDVLAAIERGEVVTQSALMRRIGVSIGLVNALLKRAVLKGYVKTRQVPYRRYAYYLTPKGFTEKSRLVAEYLDRSLYFFRQARTEYAALFAEARQRGLRRLVLVGGGELAEIAVLAAWGEDVQLLGIVDPQSNEARRYGLAVIRSLTEVGKPDAVVITEARVPQETYDTLQSQDSETPILAPPLLKITHDRAELIAAQKLRERRA